MILKFELKKFSIVSMTLAASFLSQQSFAHPSGHSDPEQAAHSQSSVRHEDDPELGVLQKALDADPENDSAAVAFARYAAKRARRVGDTALLRRAERALEPWASDAQAPTNVLIVRANIRQIDHRFEEALSDLGVVLMREPTNPQALLSRAFIRATIGEATLGLNDCAALRPNVSLTIRETCAARLGGLSGSLAAAYGRMQAVINIASTTKVEERAFALAVAADLAERIKDTEMATTYYSELLAIDPDSAYARAAYADYLLVRNENDAARTLIGDAPQTEALLLLSALAGKDSMTVGAIESATKLNARMIADRRAGDFSHAREYARFALDYQNDPKAALFFAQANWRSQKEPVDARILARSAIASDASDIVEHLKHWVGESGLEDPELARILRVPLH